MISECNFNDVRSVDVLFSVTWRRFIPLAYGLPICRGHVRKYWKLVLSVDGESGGGERDAVPGVLQGDTFRPDLSSAVIM